MRFYTYVLLNPLKPGLFRYGRWVFHHEPFYVGKGCKRRPYDHFRDDWMHKLLLTVTQKKLVQRSPKLQVIRSILLKRILPIVLVKKRNLEEADALELERKMIARIGRKDLGLGPLTNRMDGGPRNTGRIPDAVISRKITASNKRVHAARSEQRRKEIAKKISAGNKKHWQNMDEKARAKKTHANRHTLDRMTEEARAERSRKISEGRKRYFQNMTPEQRAAHSKKCSEYANKRWNNQSI